MSLSASVEKDESSHSSVGHITDPDHWRRRAEEALSLAQQLGDTPAGEEMLSVAQQYLHLEERAAARLRRPK
jgi:hypothetical protein